MNYAIIAAGEGSRLVSEGVAKPKPLINLNGTPMIRRLIDIFLSCDAEEISIIVNNEMTEVREYLESLSLPVPLHLTVKSTPSSMHSFYEVSRKFNGGKFVLTTVDTIFREDDFRGYVEAFAADGDADGYMAVTSFIDDEKPLYIDVDDEMDITAFRDKPFDGVRFISGGIYGLNDNFFKEIDKSIKKNCKNPNDIRNYMIAFQGFSQEIIMFMSNRLN
ncbi:MAG: NTP transferase domain-containing protein, partial [Muribaculaceae bacterium]|nr:NTP transferase domain-containing protein [Muribaculaceae bacterium]